MDVIKALLFSREGRIGRLMFLVSSIVWAVVGPTLLQIAIIPLTLVVIGMGALSGVLGVMGAIAAFLVVAVLLVAYVWISLNIMAKRLHDFEWSGWFGVASLVVQMLALGAILTRSGPLVVLGLLLLVVLIAFWLALVLVPGTQGYNGYGRRLRLSIE